MEYVCLAAMAAAEVVAYVEVPHRDGDGKWRYIDESGRKVG